MLVLESATLATVMELFKYKESNFHLPSFPGYTTDQWGIKAHNRPWIEENGKFAKGQKIIEVGGAYSSFPNYLGEKYDLEPWIGDDFGIASDNKRWRRWGDPEELKLKYPKTKYIFENFGNFSESYREMCFDRIFSISTLEHIEPSKRLAVIRDMNRCLKKGGIQLHTIDVGFTSLKRILLNSFMDNFSFIYSGYKSRLYSEIVHWFNLFEKSGAKIMTSRPKIHKILSREILLESYDVCYRFYPPNERAKVYTPAASLLIIIRDI
jgi:hypothetical protein